MEAALVLLLVVLFFALTYLVLVALPPPWCEPRRKSSRKTKILLVAQSDGSAGTEGQVGLRFAVWSEPRDVGTVPLDGPIEWQFIRGRSVIQVELENLHLLSTLTRSAQSISRIGVTMMFQHERLRFLAQLAVREWEAQQQPDRS